MRATLKLLAILTAALATLPFATAGTVERWSASDTAYCSVNTCNVTVHNYVYSSSSSDCIGTPGSYQACTVYHECYADVNGALITEGWVRCDTDTTVGYTGSCASTLGAGCQAYANEQAVLVYDGWCVAFMADGSAYSALTLESAYVRAPDIVVCVNGNGPSAP